MTFRHKRTNEEHKRPVHHVFLFLGAEPAVDWLKDCGVQTDTGGFVCTGAHKLEHGTSLSGVFAIGDVRSGSVKRVGAAIGEGAAVVSQIHSFLALHPAEARSVGAQQQPVHGARENGRGIHT